MAKTEQKPMLLIESLRLRRRADWPAAAFAGLGAGAVMLPPLVLGLWGPGFGALTRRVAALVLGPGVLPPPTAFDPAVALAAIVVHSFLSVLFALPLADAVYRLEAKAAVPIGAFYGLFLYLLNLYAFPIVFPWFAAQRGSAALFAHLLYGAAVSQFYGLAARSRIR
jgi:hypothetical protein